MEKDRHDSVLNMLVCVQRMCAVQQYGAFVGTVGESTPQSSYLVSESYNPVVTTVQQVPGSSVRSEGSVLGMPNSQILSTTANVSLVSRMVDVETGSIMWAASMSYEGFDIPSAMSGIAESFTRSLTPIWPSLLRACLASSRIVSISATKSAPRCAAMTSPRRSPRRRTSALRRGSIRASTIEAYRATLHRITDTGAPIPGLRSAYAGR